MANGHGGYRKPGNPAPVSGPGSMSKRTDGGPIDGQPVREVGGFEYGGRQEFAELQGSAPMAQAEALPPTPIFAPTQRPDEPITSGVPVGPGSGPSAPPVVEAGAMSAKLARLADSDATGELRRYAELLAARGL